MPQASWQAASDGRYWIDVFVAAQRFDVMIDLGLVDPSGFVGFELEPSVYDEMKAASELSHFNYRFRRDAGGRVTRTESGLTVAQLRRPPTNDEIGPAVPIFVCRGAPGIPSRVGVAFFHRLDGCRVVWKLEERIWQIECP